MSLLIGRLWLIWSQCGSVKWVKYLFEPCYHIEYHYTGMWVEFNWNGREFHNVDEYCGYDLVSFQVEMIRRSRLWSWWMVLKEIGDLCWKIG